MQPQSSPIISSPISNYQNLQQLSASPQQPQQAAPSGGNFFERLLPTIGGVGGGILGSLVSPFLGTAAGSGIGEAAGKAAENALTGQNVTSGVGSDLVSGAASGLLGAGLGKAAEGAGSMLSNLGGSLADKEASGIASQDALDKATAFKNNYGVMNDKLQRQWNLGSNADFVDSMGLESSNPYNMQHVANAGQELNSVVDQALQQSPDINVSDAFSNAILSGHAKGLRVDIGNTPFGRALQNSGIDPTQTIPRELPATVVRKLSQSVGSEIGNSQRFIQNAEDNGINPSVEKANLSDLQDIYQNLRGKLSSSPEVNSAIQNANISPELREQWTQQYGKPLSDYLTSTINNAQGYDDIVPQMQKFAQMGHASNLAIDDIENAPSTARALARAKMGAAQSGGVVTPLGAHLANAAASAAVGNHGNVVGSLIKAAGSMSPAVADRAGSVLTRIAPFVPSATIAAGTAGSLGTGGQPQNAQEVSNTMQQPQANPLDSIIQANMAQDILAPGPYGSSAGSFLESIAPQMQKSQIAGADVSNLLSSLQGAGGPQGFGGGLLSRISGLIPGTAANAYQQRQQAVAAQLAQVLGISPEAAQAMLPQLMQNAQTGGQTIGGLQGTLSALPM